jgi:hypothetical protein
MAPNPFATTPAGRSTCDRTAIQPIVCETRRQPEAAMEWAPLLADGDATRLTAHGGICCVITRIASAAFALFPIERAALGHVAASRTADFAAGRHSPNAAFHVRLERPDGDLAALPDGEGSFLFRDHVVLTLFRLRPARDQITPRPELSTARAASATQSSADG